MNKFDIAKLAGQALTPRSGATKRKSVSITNVTATHTHSPEMYNEYLQTKARINHIKKVAKMRGLSFSCADFTYQLLLRALPQVEKELGIK